MSKLELLFYIVTISMSLFSIVNYLTGWSLT